MNNFYERFAATVERFPEYAAVQVQHPDRAGTRRGDLDTFRYAELRRMAEACSGFLASRGIAPGDRCAILADNDAHWCAAYLGALRLGGVAVPLDTAYKAKQIAALARDSGAKLFFTTPRYLVAVREALATCDSAAEIVLLHGPAPDGAGHASATDLACLDEILGSPAPASLPPCPATLDSPAVILYTSGTTSDPKGVVLTHGNLLAEIEAVFQVVQVDERDSILGVLPLFHALAQMANLLLPFTVGACVVYLESVNTTELLRALQQRSISAFCCVPQFFYLIHERVMHQVGAAGLLKRAAFRALLAANGALRDLAGINLGRVSFRRIHDVLGRRMRLLVTGGSRFDPAIGRDLHRLGFTILQAYGLTECSGAATVLRPGDNRIGSVGTPLPGVEVKILPPEDSSGGENTDAAARPDDIGAAGQGEILIRGPIVMQGYFNRPEVNAAVLRDGWLHTGDLGTLDAAGRLYITGRKKEIIVLSSGKNIYPEEIEAHYLQSPYIKELCVLGLARPDEPAAERLHAVVVPDFDVMRERKVVNTREILRFEIEGLSIQLPSHKRVLSYEVWTGELPRTTTRKLKRFEIERQVRQRAATAAEEAPTQAPPLTEADVAWAAQPDVARALAVIAEAARPDHIGAAGAAAIRPDANIELELGLDSMERVELLTHLQALFGTQVPDEAAHRIYTVRELVEAVRPREGSAASTSVATGDAWGKLLAAAPEDDPSLAGLLEPKPALARAMFGLVKLSYAAARLLFRLRVTGRDQLPREGPFLLCPNHQSYLDAFLLVSALPFGVCRNLFFVGASEYFATPLMAWVARQINVVPVDPDTNLLRAMQAGAFGLRHGKVLILFPEGERSIDGEVKKFKKGAAILSLHLRAPIVPVAIAGAFDVWPRGRRPQRLARVSLRFAPPLAPPSALPPSTPFTQAESRYAAATDQLRSAVIQMWHALRAS